MADLAVAAQQAVALLVQAIDPQAIVWFGSAAQGHARPDSDLDFLVVADRRSGTRDQLFTAATQAIWDVHAPIDLLIYFVDEIAQHRESKGNVVREALATGRVVYGQV